MHSFLDLIHFKELGQKYKNIFVRFLVQMKTSKFASEIIWPLRHTYTPHSQQVRPRSNSQKQPKTVKKKKERAYYRETFFVLHLKISGFILWLFSPSTSSITRVGYSTFLFCSLLMSPLKRKEYIYICVMKVLNFHLSIRNFFFFK